MKYRTAITITSLTLLVLGCSAIAQTPIQESDTVGGLLLHNQIRDQESRLSRLESEQVQLVEMLRASNDYNKFLITMIGAIIAILVAIQGFSSFHQFRRDRQRFENQMEREKERYETHMEREKQRDEVEISGIGNVSEIMNVLYKTLQSRLDAEEDVRRQKKDLERRLREYESTVDEVKNFFDRLIQDVKGRWRELERDATVLSSTPRHGFRSKSAELANFADSFENLITDSTKFSVEHDYTARVRYCRGIAAHYANEPEIAQTYLVQAANDTTQLPGETEVECRSRRSTSYYYLGLIESNFANNHKALDYFQQADTLDKDSDDFFTRIVTAEAFVMMGDYEKSVRLINEVVKGIGSKKDVSSAESRLCSRARLMLSNIAVNQRGDNWRDKALGILRQIRKEDPRYYYATDVQARLTDNKDEAEGLYRDTYDALHEHIYTVTEVRIRILVLMIAALCCRHGLNDEAKSGEYLDQADSLLARLPSRKTATETETCTVFSALSLRNEESRVIRDHIEKIRQGQTLDPLVTESE